MKKNYCPLLVIAFLCISTLTSHAQKPNAFLALPDGLVALSSPEGQRLFIESRTKEAFWHLAQFYSTQPDLGSCSVASCTMLLNALPIQRPISASHGEFRLFTPENFFTPEVSAIRSREAVSSSGMTLDQLAAALATYAVDVKAQHADTVSPRAFRQVVKETLKRANRYVLVNYLRKSLGQETGGHISPLGAYNEAHDMVLVLDVSNYKYPWVWVKLDSLWQAMKTVDNDAKLPRGYVVVRDRASP